MKVESKNIENMEKALKTLESVLKRFSDFQEIGRMKEIIIEFWRTGKVDLLNFLKLLSSLEERSLEVSQFFLMNVWGNIDVCSFEDLEILYFLHSLKLKPLWAYTVFARSGEDVDVKKFLGKRKEKLRNKLRNCRSRFKIMDFLSVYKLIRDCDFTYDEYKSFLWLRLIRESIASYDVRVFWVSVLASLVCKELESPVRVFVGVGLNKINLEEALRNIFVKDPDRETVISIFVKFLKNLENKNRKKEGNYEKRGC